MAWFRKPKQKLTAADKRELPSDVFDKCPACSEILYRNRLAQNLYVCPACGHHHRIEAEAYVELLMDDGGFTETDPDLRSGDPLRFRDLKPYPERLKAARKATGEQDSMAIAHGQILGQPVMVVVQDFTFMGGSLGMAAGETFVKAAKEAVKRDVPLVVFTASGGARMQEGTLSLMQMARTTLALNEVKSAGLPYIVVMTDPTTGGVTASYAMLGDVHLAEPNATIGFSGRRVIEQTIRETLPPGFQRSEFLVEHGMIDQVVKRADMREKLSSILKTLMMGRERFSSAA